ncbi:c-type cytochrome biogenesis protein CcsB [Micromonospora aurantiaca]|jgi:cytochrome c-type biogenesis protein CcsB|uniref:C-type cytochrome biogenesis protein CcsB n=2 Tax=Micromonospora aurantiaca (nom. illeg.) TaxID=47850 RepID=A0ABQ6U7Q1_9ACTN|nr:MULTISPECIES: c-type cytochrome biogenesis protein CcsB [Micromonospora]KAB1102869.1 c-type cytochrome biogenesis protein CcsB [Micromonospora aurantiaca]MBC8993900.1 c-type cytochrome biogenesis protein CcsB [Micromonospora chalcea]MCT2279090.1 c-type cytochrome biogenesis protein CcsB [Micromonospora chalcea]MDG4752750.1 c-type cytochrome biogenesis protein CcsB [Micromonospora sp. WMMD718]OHX06963.1 c-type cytochrome biogenesis protein CcsB [Micromonospora sp. WMMB235]
MAALSDNLFTLALLGHLTAVIAFAAAQVAPRRVAVPVPATVPAAAVPTMAAVSRRVAIGRVVGLGAVGAAAAAQAGSLVARAAAAGRVPWGNMYEFIVAVTLVGVLAWLVLAVRRPALRPLGLYVAVCALVLLAAAGLHVYTPAGPLVPALQSVWLAVHVSAAAIASGLFLIGFVAAVALLLRARYERRGTPRSGDLRDTLAARLPAMAVWRRLSFRMHGAGFLVWTFAVMAGAVWAEAAWGRFWGWDPKETWAFISWVVYAAYLHANATASVRATTAAWVAVVGWATMMFNLFAVNLVISGLHSYAGA